MVAKERKRGALPIVAIVGRPNVGKSTLFNRLAGADKAIVESVPGVTRDRIYADVSWNGKDFVIVDTAGLEPLGTKGETGFREQAEAAIAEADLIVMVLSAADASLPQDAEIARMLKKNGKRVLHVVNKVDHKKHESLVDNFHSLGDVEPGGVSALHGRNTYELLDRIASVFSAREFPDDDEKDGDPAVRLAVLGKPNVGKSTLVNTLLKTRRMETSPVAGTTRDSVDVPFQYGGRSYVLTDTAGVRRRAKVGDGVERLATVRAIRTISECDVAVLMIDASEGPSRQDTRLASLIEDRGRAAVIALNKWDLAPEEVADAREVDFQTVLRLGGALAFAKVVRISALEGANINKLFSAVRGAAARHSKKVSTRKLNDFLKKAVSRGPSVFRGREFKAYYISQVSVRPPGFVIFTNSTGAAIPEHYQRYIERRLREEFGFEGTPIRLFFRKRKDSQRDASSKTD